VKAIKEILTTFFIVTLLSSQGAFGGIHFPKRSFVFEKESKGDKNPYDLFRILIVKKVISKYLVIDNDNRGLALYLLKRVEFGDRFIDYIGCSKFSEKISVRKISLCLDNATSFFPQDFNVFYRFEIDAAIDILTTNGFNKVL
tara:strand:+ start:2044 stop:2472 length:429 start_codon:yes stop_codon:yes gene_type:complete